MKLCLATHNPGKVREMKAILGDRFQIFSLADLGYGEEILENSETLEENSLFKAKSIFEKFNLPTIADDTGLEIEALQGAPGVYSARYAGPDCDPGANIKKVLENLGGNKNRKARFRTIMTLYNTPRSLQFEGIVEGYILTEKRGSDGFGYDPIFAPEGFEKSFSEMSANEKNAISHRGIALNKLASYLISANEF